MAQDTPTIPDRGSAPPRKREESERPTRERYVEVREIARGGMGRVIEAVDTRTQRTVALKEIIDGNPEMRARFEREVEITARLEHPSIVPLYDAGSDADGSPFYVMRKVTGAPLDTLIRKATNLDQRLRLLPNMLAVADAVAHAHARQVIHRDLKPSNVLVGQLGETIVIDWGLAKLLGDRERPEIPVSKPPGAGESLRTVAGTVFGTPGFMPPEQINGEALDPRADVYALGACLYHVLAGRPPYSGGSEEEIFQRTVAEAREPLEQVAQGVPLDLVTIVDKAMAVDPARRYLDAGGFSEDLRRFLDGQLVASHHYPLRVRMMRWLRRHRTIVAVVAFAVAVSTIGAVVSVSRIVSERARAEAAFERERTRTDELVIARATSYVESNPTLAAASLAELRADSPQWDRLGALLAEIRARGIAWGYPGTGAEQTRLEPGPRPNDERMLAAARGSVMVVDLAARTSTTIASGPDVRSGLWCGSLIVVLHLGEPTELVDPTTRGRARAPWTSADVAPRGIAIELADTGVRVYDLSRGLPVPPATTVTLPTVPKKVELSPNGNWIVATTSTGIQLYRVEGARVITEAPITLEPGARSVEVAPTETRLVYEITRPTAAAELVELDLTTNPPRERRRIASDPSETVQYVGADLYGWRFDNHQVRVIGQLPMLPRFAGFPIDVGQRRAAVTDDGDVMLTRDGVFYKLASPMPLRSIAADPTGRFLVGAAPTGVVAWDLTRFTSTTSPAPLGYYATFLGAHTLMIPEMNVTVSAERLMVHRYDIDEDLVAHEREVLPVDLGDLYGFEDGVIVNYKNDDTVQVIGGPPGLDTTGVNVITSTGTGKLLVGARTGVVSEVDRATGTRTELGRLTTKITAIAHRDGWIAALDDAGTLWRRSPQGTTTTMKAAHHCLVSVAGDGTTYAAFDGAVHLWPVAGPPSRIAFVPAVPPDIRQMVALPSAAIIVSAKGDLYRLDRRTLLTTQFFSAGRELRIGPTRAAGLVDGDLVIIDLASGDRYRVAHDPHLQPGSIALSSDEKLVVAIEPTSGGGRLHVWPIEPTSRAELIQSTNAIAPTSRGAVLWR